MLPHDDQADEAVISDQGTGEHAGKLLRATNSVVITTALFTG